MNIHHTSNKFNLFEPEIHLNDKLKLLRNVLEAFPQEIYEDDTELYLQSLMKLVAYAKIFSRDDPLPLAVAHLALGLVYIVKKSYWKQGEHHASEAIVHAENMLTSKEQINTLIESYYVMGYCRLKLGKTGEALEAATAARNCIEELGFLNNKPSNPNLEYKVAVLAAWCSPSRLQLFLESLECVGPPDKNAYIHLMIAQYYRDNKNISDALKSAKQGLEAANQFEDIAMQADASRYLAECYMESPGHGCVDEGLLLLRKTIALYTTHFSGLDTSTLSTNDLLINALLKQEMYDEALEELKAIKEAKILKFGEYSKQMADFYKQLGSLYLIQNRTKDALRVFKSCLSILNVIQTKPNSVTTSIRNTIKSLEASRTEKPAFKLHSKVK
ncbi:uncharacterized protein LOC134813351 [Bolinopsis microptera]|uniref:uncharacterized protein LOC134813351 n=1 Tax=Bolinopsis microptera TaxID=2820187 RepID=UPI003079A209